LPLCVLHLLLELRPDGHIQLFSKLGSVHLRKCSEGFLQLLSVLRTNFGRQVESLPLGV
jgi:hypothetical protein